MLQGFFERAEAHGFSGAVLVAQGDRVLLRKGYGFADRRLRKSATPATAFPIASLDKQFIAAAILRLEELGKLKTTDPLTRFFDFVPEEKAAITLHQVLSHTSGLRNEYWDEHAKMTRAQFVRFILTEQKLAAPPGQRWNYSNSGYWMLEEVIARASGMPYEEFLDKELFRPAGMEHTGLPSHHWDAGEVASYQFWATDYPRKDMLKLPRPFWEIISTVDDLYRWYRALQGDRILSAASRRKLFTPVMENYAYGWNVVHTGRGTLLRHHGGGGSNLGMTATFRWFVDEDLFLCILSNTMDPTLSADYFCADIEQIIFGGRPDLPAELPVRPPAVPGLEGEYEFPGGGQLKVIQTPAGPFVLQTHDRRAILLIRFPDLAAPAGRVPQDAQAAKVLRAVFAGDFEPLRLAMGQPKSFERIKMQVQMLAGQFKGQFGALQEVNTVYQRPFVFDGALELHSFLDARFERGDVVFRSIRFPSGELNINPVQVPKVLEVPLAPNFAGGYSTWDFTLGTGASIVFLPGDAKHPPQLQVNGTQGHTTGQRRKG